MTDNGLLAEFLLISPLLLISLVLHELSHGWVAWLLGDPTAKAHKRLSLNPIRHLDLWGTIMLVITFFGSGGTFFFGWAKPVPISPWQFKDPQRGMMLVGLAGPAANLVMALVAAGLIWLTYTWNAFLLQAFGILFVLNVILMAFNLVPIPPLDGSRVLGGFLPRKAYLQWLSLDQYGNYVFLGLVVLILAVPGLFQSTIGWVLEQSYVLLPGG